MADDAKNERAADDVKTDRASDDSKNDEPSRGREIASGAAAAPPEAGELVGASAQEADGAA